MAKIEGQYILKQSAHGGCDGYVEITPHKIAFSLLDDLYALKIINENDNVMDIGAAAGDCLLYMKRNFKTGKTSGINYYNQRHQKNVDVLSKYDIEIKYCPAASFDFSSDDSNIFFVWIENPETELEIIRQIQDAVVNFGHRECKIVIVYETMQSICHECSHCANIRHHIDMKWATYSNIGVFSTRISESHPRYQNRTVEHRHFYFNDGRGCRQAGVYSAVIVTFHTPACEDEMKIFKNEDILVETTRELPGDSLSISERNLLL